MELLRTGELARLANVNVETLRYYEREGLLAEPARTDAGYRQYGEQAIRVVQFIKHAQELGFNLKEIRELLVIQFGQDKHTAGEVKAMAEEKIQAIEEKIQSLQTIKNTLLSLTEACPGGDEGTEHCPILQEFEKPVHPVT